MHQLPRLEPYIKIRRDNATYWRGALDQFSKYLVLPEERPNTRHVWFGYPVTVKSDAPFKRADLVRFLEARGLETRPIMAGNITEQPAMKLFEHRISEDLTNSTLINNQSFFFGNHQGIGDQEREAVTGYFQEFFAEVGK